MGINNSQITLKGDFNRTVIVNDSFVNGKDCQYGNEEKFSHAEGYKSKASGMYSHADGTMATATDDYSYVWSGVSQLNNTVARNSNGIGTYSLYTNGYEPTSPDTFVNGLGYIYVNGKSAKDIFEYYRQLAVDDIRKKDNCFTQSLSFNDSDNPNTSHIVFLSQMTSLSAEGTSTFNGNAIFNGTVECNTQSNDDNSTKVANCAFVHNVIREYLKQILGKDVIKS